MEQNKYIRILEQQALPSGRDLFGQNYWIFHHDNDPKCSAKRVKAFIQDSGIHLLPYWPADLNPIENLWSTLDHKVRDRRPQNKAELSQVLQDGWNALDKDLLRKLVESIYDIRHFYRYHRICIPPMIRIVLAVTTPSVLKR